MSGGWGVLAGIVASVAGAIALVTAGLFTARATRRAAEVTAEAQRAAAGAAAEPAQRAADLATFRELREGMERRLETAEREIGSLRGLVRAFSWYVSELTGAMREHEITPPDPPARIDDYNRTGV
ncbi:hypothetical protein [Streptomyces uncialis]|uniref:hypothetical protein n=1 Tax=Streptomyces uncialis TaxID=1048205 RepID=UPI0038709664|nr:hypothetical protein OG924_12645 [Streptomyces uncialis]